MLNSSHTSAKSSHYNKGAENYDILNEENSREINKYLANLLKQHNVKSILDLTCGTGSQVFWLTKYGFSVTGVDINAEMLKIAKDKAKKNHLNLPFLEGDMRFFQKGKFDAVITIFNAIGHLTRTDFEKTIQNICKNLNNEGLYVFDIFNLDYLLHNNNITNLTIDWLSNVGDKKIREIQYSTIDKEGILASFTTSIVQEYGKNLQISNSQQTLQVYSARQLEELLQKNNFMVIAQTAIDGSKFDKFNTNRILTVAKKT